MLRLKAKRAGTYTCPNHKRAKYEDRERFSRCATCQAIYDLLSAAEAFDRAQRKAEQWISRAIVHTAGAE